MLIRLLCLRLAVRFDQGIEGPLKLAKDFEAYVRGTAVPRS